MWDIAKKKEKSFGIFVNQAKMDEEADQKLHEANQKRIINPFADVTSKDTCMGLVCMIVWCIG